MKWRVVVFVVCYFVTISDSITFWIFGKTYYADFINFLKRGLNLSNSIVDLIYPIFLFLIIYFNYYLFKRGLIKKKDFKITLIIYVLYIVIIYFFRLSIPDFT